MDEKKTKKPKKRKSRSKSFALRTALSALVFGIVFLAKTYSPGAASYVKNEIDYSMDFSYLSNEVRDYIFRYTPKP